MHPPVYQLLRKPLERCPLPLPPPAVALVLRHQQGESRERRGAVQVAGEAQDGRVAGAGAVRLGWPGQQEACEGRGVGGRD